MVLTRSAMGKARAPWCALKFLPNTFYVLNVQFLEQ